FPWRSPCSYSERLPYDALHPADSIVDREKFHLTAAPVLKLDLPFNKILSPDHHPERDADQVGILELDPRPLVTVVIQDFDAESEKFCIDILCSLAHRIIFGVDRGDDTVKGSDRQREDDTVLVVVLLDAGCDGPADADAVAPHEYDLFFAVRIEEGGVKRLRVFHAELEDMTDLDAAPHLKGAARTARAGVTVGDITDIGVFGEGKITVVIDVFQVVVGLVGSADEIPHPLYCRIGNDPNRPANRTEEADRSICRLCYDLVGRHFELFTAQNLFQLDLVQIVVAPQKNGHRLIISHHDQHFDRRGGGHLEKLTYILDTLLARCVNLFQGPRFGMFFCFDEPRFGLFDIGRIVAGTARDDRILSRIGQHHEFMGPVPADRAGVGLDGTEFETATLKDPAIRLIHLFVGDISTLFVSVEGVGILHDELAAAHQTETGPDLVAELGLNLVEIERHLPVAAHFPADDVRHDLFVRRSEAELVVLAVLDAEQLFAVLPPATRFLPEFGRGHHRHKDLDRSGPVHLFADDSFDLADRFQPERQVIVDSGSDLSDHSGAEHQLMRNDFGISRSFLNCGYKVLAVTHCITSFNIYTFIYSTSFCILCRL